jgi:hypothetical protein
MGTLATRHDRDAADTQLTASPTEQIEPVSVSRPDVAVASGEVHVLQSDDQLAGVLERHGLAPGETTGLGARATPLAVLRSLASARLGRITYGELSRRLDVGQVSSTAVSYMGFVTKTQR